MDNGCKSPVPRRSVISDGGTPQARGGGQTSTLQAGRGAGQANPPGEPETRVEGAAAMANPDALRPERPRKASSEDRRARTANRHRWAGRAYQGGRETLRQGTRQLRSVTSGEGAPR